MKQSRLVLFCTCALTLLLNVSCSSSSALGEAAKSAASFSIAKVWLEKIKFKVATDVNNNAPVAVHALVVYDQDVLNKLSQLPADKYFSQEQQFRKDFNEKVDFNVWEIVPGQNLDDQPFNPTKVSGLAVIIYARYSTPGDHRAIIGDDRETLIDLQKLDFTTTKIR